MTEHDIGKVRGRPGPQPVDPSADRPSRGGAVDSDNAREKRLDLLREVGRKAGSVPELSSLVGQIARLTRKTLRASASSVLLLDEEKQELFFEFADGGAGPLLERVRFGVQFGIAGWVARHGKPEVVNDVTRDRRFCSAFDSITGFVTKSLMCAPLLVRGRAIGVIEVLNKLNGSDFNRQDLESLEAVASTAAMAIELERTEEALRQSEENYRVLFESTFDGIVVVDAVTMKVLFGNRRASQLLGFDVQGRAKGMNVLDVVHPEDRQSVVDGIARDLESSGRRKRYEVRVITGDGNEMWVSVLATRIEFQGSPAVLLSVRDITERIEAEEERKRLEEQLLIAGRLAAVGELAAGVAHELNNPLAAIQAFAQFMAGRDDLVPGLREDVETIYREAQRATRITANLLSFARRHPPEKRLISINDVLERSLELHAYRLSVNGIEVVRDLAPDLPRTMADFHQMQQVFVNIIDNAEQAMTQAHGRGKLVVRTQKVGGMIRTTFVDDGPGISRKDLKRLFDPFFTTKEVGQGTGLGLSICYGLVQAHDGHLYARSRLGEGATFVVELPLIAEDARTGGETGPARSPTAVL